MSTNTVAVKILTPMMAKSQMPMVAVQTQSGRWKSSTEDPASPKPAAIHATIRISSSRTVPAASFRTCRYFS